MEHIYKNIKGWFNFQKQYDFVLDQIPHGGTFVEVGSYLGKSLSYVVIENIIRKKELDIHCVDYWGGNPHVENYMNGMKNFDKLYNKFKNNTKSISEYFTCHRKLSWEAAELFDDESVDYVMIDAGHDYESVKKDINAWWPKVKKGGIIGGDDFSHLKTNEVKIAVEEFCKQQGERDKKDIFYNLFPNLKKNNPNIVSRVNKNWYIIK